MMKTFELNVTDYKTDKDEVNMREELSQLLRLPGIYDDGVETCDGVILAKAIRESSEDTKTISEEDLTLLKKVMNKLIAKPHQPQLGQISLGGIRYEEMIMRVFLLDKKE